MGGCLSAPHAVEAQADEEEFQVQRSRASEYGVGGVERLLSLTVRRPPRESKPPFVPVGGLAELAASPRGAGEILQVSAPGGGARGRRAVRGGRGAEPWAGAGDARVPPRRAAAFPRTLTLSERILLPRSHAPPPPPPPCST